jgi:hypothetical protein
VPICLPIVTGQKEISMSNGWPTSNSPEVDTNVEAESEADFFKRRDAEIQTWLDERDALAKHKDAEAEARRKIIATLFPKPKKGTQRYDLANDHKVKLVYNMTAKLGDKDLVDEEDKPITVETQVRKVIEEIERRFYFCKTFIHF